MSPELLEKIQKYKTPTQAIAIVKQTKIVLLCGPSGAGKSLIKHHLLSGSGYHHIISHTTRKPRFNHGQLEQNGQDYYFISLKQAETMVGNQEFIEVKVYAGNLYGTSTHEIELAHSENKVALTDVEVQGVGEYKQIDKNVIAVFVLPPNFKIWQARLAKRYGEEINAEDYIHRLSTALDEIKELKTKGYFLPIVNYNFNDSINIINNLVSDKPNNLDFAVAYQQADKLNQDINKFISKES